MNNNEYEVGYGKPPKSGQFKKGQSGNPKGRKKKVIPESIFEAIELELASKIKITNAKGQKADAYLFEVLAKQILQDALSKDGYSRKTLLEHYHKNHILQSVQYIKETFYKDKAKDENPILDKKQKEFLLNKLAQFVAAREAQENSQQE